MSENQTAKFTTTRPNSRVITVEGKSLYFKGNVMLLDDPVDIAYLRSLIKCSDGCISERPVDEADTEDPIAKIKEAAIAEYLAKTAVATKNLDVNDAIVLSTASTQTKPK